MFGEAGGQHALVDMVKAYPRRATGDFEVGQEFEDCLMKYCSKVVCRELKTKHGEERQYELNNFSLILTYEQCDMQGVHMDTKAPNYTGFMSLCDDIPPTQLFCTPGGGKIAEWDDLVDYVASQERAKNNEQGVHEMRYLYQTLKDSVAEYLVDYGNCLLPYEPCSSGTDNNQVKKINLGEVGLIDGDQLHAGPRCTSLRVVLFFRKSAWGG
jgi:hypothetical protein